jgi:hypothetical protein
MQATEHHEAKLHHDFKVPLDEIAMIEKEDAAHPHLERLAYGNL